jgi:hypothetical protein
VFFETKLRTEIFNFLDVSKNLTEAAASAPPELDPFQFSQQSLPGGGGKFGQSRRASLTVKSGPAESVRKYCILLL